MSTAFCCDFCGNISGKTREYDRFPISWKTIGRPNADFAVDHWCGECDPRKPEAEVDESATKEINCVYLSNSGEPCSNPRIAGKMFCVVHE